MTDHEALDQIIHYHQYAFDKNLYVIVDLDYTVVAEDGRSAEVTNTKGGCFLGRKIYPDISHAAWRSEIVAKNLEACLTERKTSKWLSLRFSRNPKYWLVILTYTPLINPDTDNVVGYKISGESPNFPLVFYNLEKIIQIAHHDVTPSVEDDGLLTLQEQAILFLLFHCDNYQQVADLLTLSYRKVMSKSMVSKIVIRKIYPKFKVGNLPSLKQAAHEAGYHKKIPLVLLGEFMFELEDL